MTLLKTYIVEDYKLKPGQDLRGADLSEQQIPRANLKGSNLSINPDTEMPVQVFYSDLSGSDLSECDLEGICAASATIKEANISKSTARNSNFYNSDLQGTNFSESDIDGSDFQKTNLKKVKMYRTKATNSNFWRSDMSESDLREANFSGSKLRGVNFEGAYMTGINFENADLSFAYLGANFEANKTTGTRLNGAIVVDETGQEYEIIGNYPKTKSRGYHLITGDQNSFNKIVSKFKENQNANDDGSNKK